MARSKMPTAIEPMRAVVGTLDADDAGWAYEIKWDGMREIAFCDRGSLRLQTSNGLDATGRFPEIAPLAESLGDHQVVLDGEVVAFSEDGRPDFGRLQSRMHGISPHATTEPVAITMVVFDLLWLDGLDVMPVPYLERRRLLTDLVEPGASWQVPNHQVGDGAVLLDAVTQRGLEGIMAKRTESTYTAGRRSPAWRKIKVRRRQELVVGGWLAGEGARSSTFGALLVGYHTPEGLHYAGRVGTGFDAGDLELLRRELAARSRPDPPFDPAPPRPVARMAHWVEADLVVEVEFGEWTSAGMLRHPSYVGLRIDKDASRVVREPSP